MGIRSFLIKFDNINQIISFFLWRKYLAFLVCDYYDDKYTLEDIEKIIINNKLYLGYDKKDFGDFDLYLVGFKFFGGAIWGLISTYSVGEVTFELLVQKILKCYYSRLSAIDVEATNYNDHEAIFISNYSENQNLIEASKIFLELYNKYKYKLINYDFLKNYRLINIDENNFISFNT